MPSRRLKNNIIYSHISKQRNIEIHTIIEKKIKIKMKLKYLAMSQNAMFR